MNTPTAKYKDLMEKEDVEEEDATHEEEDNVNESKKTKKTLSLTEAQLVSLIERVVKEQESGDIEDDKIAKAKEEKEVSRVEKAAETAKVTMKNFEDAVKKVREQKDLKIGQKVELSAFR